MLHSTARIVIALALTLLMGMSVSNSAYAVGPAYSGSWFNPNQDGHGFSLEYATLNDGTRLVIAYWYVYDSEGHPIFLVGQGEVLEDNFVVLDFIAPHGMKFGEFSAEQTIREDGGIGTFTFKNDETGTYEYEPSDWMIKNYGVSPISIPIVKLIGVALVETPLVETYVDTYIGKWRGRMTYDETSPGECHNADVELDVYPGPFGNIPYEWSFSTTVFRDSGGISVHQNRTPYIRDSGFALGSIWVFGDAIDVNIQFPALQTYGYAEGHWSYADGKCYGEWSVTKQ